MILVSTMNRLSHNDIARMLRVVVREHGKDPAELDGLIYDWSQQWQGCALTCTQELKSLFHARLIKLYGPPTVGQPYR